MPPKKTNTSATELWAQVLSRLSKREDAALWDPTYDPTEDRLKLREALKKAGWSDHHIKYRLEIEEERLSKAPVTSPGVNPHVEVHLEALRSDVEAAMERLNLTSHVRVALGVEPRIGPFAASINVTMTDESIVTVGSHLFRFCGVVARAITRTIHLNPYLWDADDYDEKFASRCLRRSPELLKYWMHIYFSYASTGTNVLVPFRPATRDELMLFEQIARAMEIFAIAHEYGHHNFGHGRTVGEDTHREEFEADQFALKICYEVERHPLFMSNPYLSSGAGGVALLLALQTLRQVEALLPTQKPPHDVSTHPDVDSRIERFDSVSVVMPNEFTALKRFRLACSRIITAVDDELLTPLRAVAPKFTGTSDESDAHNS